MPEGLPNSLRLNGHLLQQPELAAATGHFPESDSLIASVIDFLRLWFDDDDSIDQQTSGSTGQPKLIRLSKQAMVNSAAMTNSFFQLEKAHQALLCLSPEYIAGKMMIVRAMLSGMNLLTSTVGSNPLAECVRPIDFAAMVPLQVSTILKHDPDKLSLVSKLIIGGSAIDARLEALLQHQQTKCWHTYGMTETISHIALRKVNGVDRSDWFSPLDNIRLSTDSRQCLVIDAPALHNETLITNDLVELRNDGSFRMLGRVDDVIVSAGHKIHPLLLEKKISPLLPYPFLISSVPHPEAGSETVLVIGHTYGIGELFALWKALEEKLSPVEMPRRIAFIEQIPSLPGEKTDRNTVRKLLLQHLSKNLTEHT
ncbi:MAG: AMP-binding protein [Bacteroidetes bacterium]|nr:AMP-binding protein [Bacteroidota bacterium]